MNAMDMKSMRPFFSFDFYTFEYQSPTANGPDPVFEVTKFYDVNVNNDLIKYLNNQFLKIDFIDENVDLDASPEANDYIGSARYSLKGLLTEERFNGKLDIMNEKGIQTG